ncbi:hypothetical protein AJ80_02130 [Polytolypa hystricis UAMH7299]|uniref:Uncharacterized protein n=1 Tax=Polytolypa hystricis (strain UAMH7299) TaxID=1447883 RepID=A0A2B7YS53_POLH7|nr:hypothetical protein AJ80_02130 [Polytolypa hystricis UAMH7299]
MNGRCPCHSLSYASWRLRTIRNLFQTLSISIHHPSVRAFSSSAALQYPRPPRRPPPSERRRQRRVGQSARAKEIASLETLQSDLSELIQQFSTKERATNKEPTPLSSTASKPTSTRSKPFQRWRTSESLIKSPIALRLKRREEKKKRRATEEEKDRLRFNPWAQALASPVRICAATGIRLPTSALQEWGLIQHPATQALWLMPTGLLHDELRKARNTSQAGNEDRKAGSEWKPVLPRKHFPSFRITNNYDILDKVTQVPKNIMIRNLLPRDWKVPRGQITGTDEKKAVWRADMPSFVLETMKREVVKALKNAHMPEDATTKDSDAWTVLKLGGSGDAGLRKAVGKLSGLQHLSWGAVLITHANSSKQDNVPEEDARTASDPMNDLDEGAASPCEEEASPTSNRLSNEQSQYPDYVPLPTPENKVPVFDLTKLLSEPQLEELKQHVKIYRKPALFFRPDSTKSVALMQSLWDLKLFMTPLDGTR